MAEGNPNPLLKALHRLVPGKVREMEKLSDEDLIRSLKPGQVHCLKTRPDGTILDGHHRIHILRGRGVSVDDLPREIIEREIIEKDAER